MSGTLSRLEPALEIATLGLRVFPLWWPRDGGCACRFGRDCRQPGKHPRIQGWQQEASLEPGKIQAWWTQWPMANIGVATGGSADQPLSGIMVLDVDSASGGLESLAALEAAHGELPETVEVITGRGNLDGVRGRHLYFRHPGVPLGNSVQRLGPGLDLRCDGGLVVGPGSEHRSGLVYEWEISHHPEDTPFADVPRWLLDLLVAAPRRLPAIVSNDWVEPKGLPPREVRIDRAQAWLAERAPAVQGQNGSSRTMGICAVITRGFAIEDDDAALSALAEWNARCSPPWDEHPEAPAADSLLRKIREGRAKGHVIGIGDKLLPPRRAYFGSHLAGSVGPQSTEGTPDATETSAEVRIMAVTGDHGELPELVRAAEQALQRQAIYTFGGQLVTVTQGASGPNLALVHRDHLRVLVNGVIGFAKPHGKEFRPCWPPDEVLGGLLNKNAWDLPEITGLCETPTLRPDGSVITHPGYDPPTGLMFVSRPVPWEPIPEEPTADELEVAKLWLREPFVDFPFQAPHHEAGAIAALLTAVLRPAIAGPVPMFLFDANTPGTGKGLLANVVALVATGRRAPILSAPGDDEELRKLITSLAIQGSRLVILDNVDRPLGGSTLDAAITSTTWQGRILGGNRTFDGPLRPFWAATGNNIRLRGDMPRRVVTVRMSSTVESPELRQGFVHPDLLTWVTEERAALVAAALTVVRAHRLAGAPRPPGLARLGGFESWDDLVRAPLVWLGLPDVLDSRQELRQQDGETAAFQTVLEAWHHAYGNGPRTLQQVKRNTETPTDPTLEALREALIELAPAKDGKDWDATRVRTLFRRYQERVFGCLRLATGERASAGMRWCVERLEPETV